MKLGWSEKRQDDFSGVRRDCQPHRGQVLLVAAFVCLIAGLPILFPLAPIVFACSLAVWITARRDIAEMRLGVRDPTGYRTTVRARFHASSAIFVSAFSTLVLLVMVAPLLLHNATRT